MAKNKYMTELSKLPGAVTERYNPHLNVLQTPSPSVNFTFANGWGLPAGYSMALYGPPKGGKSVICNAMIGQLHKDDVDAIAIKFNTEMRETGQAFDPAIWGIDEDRYLAYDVNSAVKVFDYIQKDIKAQCQAGAPIKLIVIDSLNQLEGRISEGMESVGDVVMGDDARTLGIGLKRILPVLREFKIALIVTTHLRAEMDAMKVRMTHRSYKMAASWAVQHFTEYFMFVEPILGKDGKLNAFKQEMTNSGVKDLQGREDRTAHKVRVTMTDSSMGPSGRSGIFTFDYVNGIVNTYEEVFLLGVNRGVIQKPNNKTYVFGDNKWTGAPSMLLAIKENEDLYNSILKAVKQQDIDKKYPTVERNATLEEELAE